MGPTLHEKNVVEKNWSTVALFINLSIHITATPKYIVHSFI